MAISQAVANAILGQRAPDILGSFEQGQEVARGREERSRARQIQELSGQAYKGDAEAFSELQGIAPEVALELQNKLNIKDKGGLDRLYTDARTALSIYENYGVEGVISFGENRIQGLKSMFADTQDTERALNFFKTGNIEEGVANLKATISALEQANSRGPTGAMRERQALLNDLNSTNEDVRRSAKVALKLMAAPIGSAMTTLSGGSEEDQDAFTDLTENVDYSKTKGKLKAEFKFKPEVAEAVQLATLQAKDAADLFVENRGNNRALAVYDTSIDTVRSAFDKASTGPIAGWFTAMGANNQMAKASVAMMGPLMKDIFRSAGEGTFTDGDQALLMSMLPSTSDKPEAVAFKLEFMDKIIRSKLAAQEVESGATDKPARRVFGAKR